MKANKDEVAIDDNTSEVTPSVDALVAELETMNDTLFSQDKMLKRAALRGKSLRTS